MNDNDRLFLKLLGIAAPMPEKCVPFVAYRDTDLLVKRCKHGKTEFAIRPLFEGMKPGPRRAMAEAN